MVQIFFFPSFFHQPTKRNKPYRINYNIDNPSLPFAFAIPAFAIRKLGSVYFHDSNKTGLRQIFLLFTPKQYVKLDHLARRTIFLKHHKATKHNGLFEIFCPLKNSQAFT